MGCHLFTACSSIVTLGSKGRGVKWSIHFIALYAYALEIRFGDGEKKSVMFACPYDAYTYIFQGHFCLARWELQMAKHNLQGSEMANLRPVAAVPQC